MARKAIGIVGGLGPEAGIDLHRRILRLTGARSDGEHLEVVLHTNTLIPDRTGFLLGRSPENPSRQIVRSVDLLVASGCEVIGMPCNTAHAPAIVAPVFEHLRRTHPSVRMPHLIAETVERIRSLAPGIARVGLLASTGTIATRIYQDRLEPLGIETLVPAPEEQERSVMAAIYDRDFGIKARSWPVEARATELLRASAEKLMSRGAQAVILGCTELPLALDRPDLNGVPLIVPSEVLAAELVRLATEGTPLGRV